MQVDIEVAGRTRQVAVTRAGDGFIVTIDGRVWPVSIARVDAHTVSLLIAGRGRSLGGTSGAASDASRTSYEVTIVPNRATGQLIVHVGASIVAVGLDSRRGMSRKDSDGHSSAGPQRVVAAMPGRVVRVLVRPGDVVRAGQGLVVIEAMKMENELRAARNGRVSEVRAREAMSVEAGALLVVIE